ncbi:MAG: glycosyltransferase family 1 protein [Acidobacteria bacterium]|jgi:glycosyltransferase involved in cell wall biosynthesis|nr:MAG: glycosyltransferase family 1 protein [Acidobacteriota bacterium]
MKILLVHNHYQMPGGESIVFDNLHRLLKQVGQESIIYSRHNSEISHFNLKQKALMGIEGFFSMRTWREIRRLIQKEKPQVAIVQNVFPLISPSVYYALKSSNVPVIQAVYNYRFVCPNGHLFCNGAICERCVGGNYWNAVIRKCYRNSYIISGWYAAILTFCRLTGTFARKIDVFMVPDNFLGTRLIAGGIPAAKITKNVNPFFVEDYQFHYGQGKFILYVGRLVRQKGVFTLINAMTRVSSDGLPLYIVGEGEERKALELLIIRLGLQDRVRILGPKWGGRVKQLIQESAFLVVPSEWYDNLPLIICQAYASGKPVIASAINGIPEYVEDGVDGLLFQPGDAQDLARCIECLSTDSTLLAEMSVNARRKAEQKLDYRVYWNKLNDIIKKLL